MSFSVRGVRLSDAGDLRRNCFPAQPLAWAESYLRWCIQQVGKGRMVRLVAEVDGQVVANGQLSILRRRGEIGSLVVAVPYRRRGIGDALLGALVDAARARDLDEVEIWADATVPWVRAWYERRGFSFVEERALSGRVRVDVLRIEPLAGQGQAELQES